MTEDFSEREKNAFLEDLRGEFSLPLDVIVTYAELLLENLRLKPELRDIFSPDLRKILHEGKTLQKEVDDAFNLAILKQKQLTDVSEFIRTLEYTLTTPLNSIIGYCELLFEEEFSLCGGQMGNDLKKILESAQLFIGFIKKISSIAKTKFQGGNLASQYEQISSMIRNVVTSIPSLVEIEVLPSVKKEGIVLIIDDNNMEMDLFVRLVESCGYNAIPVKSRRRS